jgi:hypothetical protein
VFVGLWAMGVDYALLWGCLAAVLRFVPYVGPISAAAMPIALATVQFPGWTQPLLVAGMFVVLELVMNNVLEPLAYGRSTGVATLPLLVALAFWTWCWGPMGLALAIPMTVVVAVVSRHVAQLEPLNVLLGDAPALEPYVVYYQRLLAGDVEEAAEIVAEQLRHRDRLAIADTLVVPALALAERDRGREELTTAQQQRIWQATRELIADESAEPEPAADAHPDQAPRVDVLGVAARDQADEIALELLGQAIPSQCVLRSFPAKALAAEVLDAMSVQTPDVVCISALGPDGGATTRYLFKRIRQRYPQLEIVVGRWGYTADRDRLAEHLRARGATHVTTRLAEAVDLLGRAQPGLVKA